MKTVEIGYRLLWIPMKKKKEVPGSWLEVNADQLIVIAENYMGVCSEFRLLAEMCGVSEKVIQKMPAFFRFKLAEEFEFMKDFKPSNSFILKKVKNLQAPKSRLEAMTFGQFIFVDTFYNDWCQDEKTETLNKFVACLYLPKHYTFSEKYIEENAAAVAKIDERVKYAITLNYRLVKEWLTERYPMVFEKPDPTQKKRKKTGKAGNGWVSIFESIVGDDITRADDYAKVPVHSVMRFLTKKIKENAKK